jgi:hypothetical protein
VQVYINPRPGSPGTRYRKAVYRGYVDANFTTLLPKAGHGILGPLIYAEVGDSITIVFRVGVLPPSPPLLPGLPSLIILPLSLQLEATLRCNGLALQIHSPLERGRTDRDMSGRHVGAALPSLRPSIWFQNRDPEFQCWGFLLLTCPF